MPWEKSAQNCVFLSSPISRLKYFHVMYKSEYNGILGASMYEGHKEKSQGNWQWVSNVHYFLRQSYDFYIDKIYA